MPKMPWLVPCHRPISHSESIATASAWATPPSPMLERCTLPTARCPALPSRRAHPRSERKAGRRRWRGRRCVVRGSRRPVARRRRRAESGGRRQRLPVRGDAWAVRRADTMLQVFVGPGSSRAPIRPHLLGEAWLVGMVGAAGCGGAPGPETHAARRRMDVSGGGRRSGHFRRRARVAELVFGRSLAEARAILER